VTFAENLSQFFSPTFDTRYDTVYALMIVGNNPHLNRGSISKIKNFVNLATAHKCSKKVCIDRDGDDIKDEKIQHCQQFKIDKNDKRCTNAESFVAIHFNSFCSEICSDKQCSRANERSKTNHASCTQKSSKEESPYGPSWCSCPSTQILEFSKNKAPINIDNTVPLVPIAPSIEKVTGHLYHETEIFGRKQSIKVHIKNIDPTTRTLQFILRYTKLNAFSDISDIMIFQQKYESVVDTTVTLRNLHAGQTYDIAVKGINDIGEGLPSNIIVTKIGFPMVDVGVYNIKTTEFIKENEIILKNYKYYDTASALPADREVLLRLIMSTKFPPIIERVTLHQEFSSEQDINNNKPLKLDEKSEYTECENVTNNMLPHEDVAAKSFQDVFTTCSIIVKSNEIGMDDNQDEMIMELRIWNKMNFLVAKNNITVTKGALV